MPKKESRRAKIQARARHAGKWGQDKIAQPGGLVDRARRGLLFWFRKVWKTRGGGLYALGFALTFLYLEFVDIVFDDIPKLIFMEHYDASALIEFAIEFVVDTLVNTLFAFIWPAMLVGWEAPWGLIVLIAAVVVFPKHIKPHIERWLLDGPVTSEDAKSEDSDADDR